MLQYLNRFELIWKRDRARTRSGGAFAQRIQTKLVCQATKMCSCRTEENNDIVLHWMFTCKYDLRIYFHNIGPLKKGTRRNRWFFSQTLSLLELPFQEVEIELVYDVPSCFEQTIRTTTRTIWNGEKSPKKVECRNSCALARDPLGTCDIVQSG